MYKLFYNLTWSSQYRVLLYSIPTGIVFVAESKQLLHSLVNGMLYASNQSNRSKRMNGHQGDHCGDTGLAFSRHVISSCEWKNITTVLYMSKPGTWFPTSLSFVLLSVKMRCDCSLCWYWWNWWPLLFKLFIHNDL